MNVVSNFSALSTEPEPKSDDSWPWSEELSDELKYEGAVQPSDLEQEDNIDTSEWHAILLKSPKNGIYFKIS